MSTRFVNELRAQRETLRIDGSGPRMTVRVEMPEVWDVVRLDAPASEPVVAVKVRALQALYPEADFHDDFVVKLRGHEVLDESLPLEAAGAMDGSTFLVTGRRRRPVR